MFQCTFRCLYIVIFESLLFFNCLQVFIYLFKTTVNCRRMCQNNVTEKDMPKRKIEMV